MEFDAGNHVLAASGCALRGDLASLPPAEWDIRFVQRRISNACFDAPLQLSSGEGGAERVHEASVDGGENSPQVACPTALAVGRGRSL